MATTYDVIVIGGGAAGLMAAGRAAECGRHVLLLEKNSELGKKLSITGGGRCNIYNAEEDVHRLLAHYGSAEKFLYSAFSQFGVNETQTFFTSRGLEIKVEARKRAFPVSEKASDVVRLMTDYVRRGQVEIRTGATVQAITVGEGRVIGVDIDGEMLTAESYILATGGKSHPETGSTGDGFRWLHDAGHTVAVPTPALVPIAVRDRWIHKLSGTSFDDVKVSFFVDGEKRFTLAGRILCTHFGLSGPLIMNASKKIASLLPEGEVTGGIDLFPKRDVGAVDRYLTEIFDEHKNKSLVNVLKFVAPAGTARVILELLSDIDPETKVHSVTKPQRKALAEVLKRLPFEVTGLMGLDRAIVVDGGLGVEEVDGRTMRSRLYSNLFVTGDVLHIPRPSGGYSLQLCWTTGWVAGSNA